MLKRLIYIGTIVLLVSRIGFAQISQSMDSTSNYRSSSNINSVGEKVTFSLKHSKNDLEVASYFEKLAIELLKSKDTAKAEEYFNKALALYRKSKNTEKIAELSREIAKIQESQKNFTQAKLNYQKASKVSKNQSIQLLNTNDAYRLEENSTPEMKLELIQKNVQVLEKEKKADSKEMTQAYIQLAEANVKMEKPDEAIANYNKALETSNDKSIEDKTKIINSMADIYVDKNMYEKAIELQKLALISADTVYDKHSKIMQLQQLSSIYFKYGKTDEGFKTLQEAYHTALKNGKLKDAKESLQLLIGHYEQSKATDKILPLYKSFVGGLDSLIKADSSIVDIKLFQITEERIAQLEKERELKDELIGRKNKYNAVLIGSVLLLILLLGIIIKAWNSIKKRNKKIALQSLRREMNPHFIFNSLNSVNQFIASNNELEANKFLSSYSNLMRNFMENSNKDFISLSAEIEQLKKYLNLEKLRFADKFEYEIQVDDNVDSDSEKVPNMLVQPNVENAIWHGLRYKETKGLLKLQFKKVGNSMLIVIDDNGIGLKKSKEIKTNNQKLHESRGLTNVEERIKLLNEIYKTKIRFDISEKKGQESGVEVKIEW